MLKLRDDGETVLDVTEIRKLYKREDEDEYKICYELKNDSDEYLLNYEDEDTRDEDFEKLLSKPTKQETSMNSIKEYVKQHKDILMSVALIILIDHFLLNGALKKRIQTSLESVLDGLQKRLK